MIAEKAEGEQRNLQSSLTIMRNPTMNNSDTHSAQILLQDFCLALPVSCSFSMVRVQRAGICKPFLPHSRTLSRIHPCTSGCTDTKSAGFKLQIAWNSYSCRIIGFIFLFFHFQNQTPAHKQLLPLQPPAISAATGDSWLRYYQQWNAGSFL